MAFTGRTIGASYQYNDLTVNAVFVNYKIAGSLDKPRIRRRARLSDQAIRECGCRCLVCERRQHLDNHSILAAAGLTYGLSKATLLYGQIGYVNNHVKMDTGLSTNGALYGVAGSTVTSVTCSDDAGSSV